MKGYPEHLHEAINEDLQESIYDETLEEDYTRDSKYSLEIMRQELDNKYICPEIKYAFKNSIQALSKQVSKKIIETPAFQSYYSAGDESETLCPNCENELEIENQTKYCCECGQKLDWSDFE